VPQHLSIYVVEDLQKQLRGCAQEISIYQTKLSKLEAQLPRYNKEFIIVSEIEESVPEAEQDMHDRITSLKRQLTENYTSYYYLLMQRRLTLSWKVVEYNMIVQEIERLSNQTVD
jgi:hypothetical protein